MDIEVRPLQVDDIFTVAGMLSKVTEGARTELAQAFAAENPNPTELGMALFQTMFVEAKEDLKSWLAGLIGRTQEEFGVMPPTTLIDIIEALIKQEDIVDFFARVSQLVSKAEKVV